MGEQGEYANLCYCLFYKKLRTDRKSIPSSQKQETKFSFHSEKDKGNSLIKYQR